MAARDFATVADLAARWREFSPEESSLASTLISDASQIMREKADCSNADANTLRIVCCNMVRRAMTSPDASSVYDGDDSYIYRAFTPAKALRLYANEISLISGIGIASVPASRHTR